MMKSKSEALRRIEEAERTGATDIELRDLNLSRVSDQLSRCHQVTRLDLRHNRLTELPDLIRQLTNLEGLNVDFNQLTGLPDFIGKLGNLRSLFIGNNRLTRLPESLGQLVNLGGLNVADNELTVLPDSFGQLAQLHTLFIDGNLLTFLPDFLGQLTRLMTFNAYSNKLKALPESLGQLTNLGSLDVSRNQLTSLPESLGRLAKLRYLNVSNNQLTVLPDSIGWLSELTNLDVSGNPLVFPPLDVAALGTNAILAYLREGNRFRPMRAKLIVVGEAKAGKTSLLKALNGERPDPNESQTHGIRIGTLPLLYPDEPRGTMTLNTWDFGGQVIYHATHQFFLTDRALFLLLWNARSGVELGKLHYWLDMIRARAPHSKVILIATHLDDAKSADIHFQALREEYGDLLIPEHFEVSCTAGTGINRLKSAIQREASTMPAMNAEWPRRWLDAADAVRAVNRQTMTPSELYSGPRNSDQAIS